MKFPGNERSSSSCHIVDADEQEITVLKHLLIVSKEIVLDLAVRQVRLVYIFRQCPKIFRR